MTYMSFAKNRFLNFSFFADESLFSDHISLVIPQEGPLWKQGCIDLFNAIPAIFSLGYFLNQSFSFFSSACKFSIIVNRFLFWFFFPFFIMNCNFIYLYGKIIHTYIHI